MERVSVRAPLMAVGVRPLVAEAIGTFCLVFAGTGAIMVDEQSKGAVTHVGVALTFGLIVMAMIDAFGDVSGAHLNPAVTIGFWASGRFPGRGVWGYVTAQVVGAIGASAVLRVMFPQSVTLGETVPSGQVWQSLVMEGVLSFMLMTVILSVSSGPKEKGMRAGVAVGGVVAMEALFGGPVSGASMNPARSVGPALVSGHVAWVWVYVAGPIAGMLVAVVVGAVVREGVITARRG